MIPGRRVAQAPLIVASPLAEKLTFTPADKDGRQGFRFKAVGTVEKLVAGVVAEL